MRLTLTAAFAKWTLAALVLCGLPCAAGYAAQRGGEVVGGRAQGEARPPNPAPATETSNDVPQSREDVAQSREEVEEEARARAARWRAMSPERRAELERRFKELSALPEAEREALATRSRELQRIENDVLDELSVEQRARIAALDVEHRRDLMRELVLDRARERAERLREALPPDQIEGLRRGEDRERLFGELRRQHERELPGHLARLAAELELPAAERERLAALPPEAQRAEFGELMRLRVRRWYEDEGAPAGLDPRALERLLDAPPDVFARRYGRVREHFGGGPPGHGRPPRGRRGEGGPGGPEGRGGPDGPGGPGGAEGPRGRPGSDGANGPGDGPDRGPLGGPPGGRGDRPDMRGRPLGGPPSRGETPGLDPGPPPPRGGPPRPGNRGLEAGPPRGGPPDVGFADDAALEGPSSTLAERNAARWMRQIREAGAPTVAERIDFAERAPALRARLLGELGRARILVVLAELGVGAAELETLKALEPRAFRRATRDAVLRHLGVAPRSTTAPEFPKPGVGAQRR